MRFCWLGLFIGLRFALGWFVCFNFGLGVDVSSTNASYCGCGLELVSRFGVLMRRFVFAT